MDGRGRALDDVFVERLWRSGKYECLYLPGFATVGLAQGAVKFVKQSLAKAPRQARTRSGLE